MKVDYCKIKRVRVRHYSTMDLSGLVVYFCLLQLLRDSSIVFFVRFTSSMTVTVTAVWLFFVVWQFDICHWTVDMTCFDLYDCGKDMTWCLTTKSDIGQHSNSCLIFVFLGSVFVRLLVVRLIVVRLLVVVVVFVSVVIVWVLVVVFNH